MRRHGLVFGAAASVVTLAASALVACSSTPADTPAADAAVADSAVVDAAVPDVAVPDTSVPDTAPPDAADAAVPDAAPDTATPDAAVTCGVAGDQVFDPIQAFVPLNNSTSDVSIHANVCDSTVLTFPYNQTRTLTIPRNVPFHFVATQAGNLPALSQENNVKSAAFPKLVHGAWLLPLAHAVSIDPAWTASTHALLRVVVNASTGTGACSTKDGVSYTVVGHPEAVIKYANGGVGATGAGAGDTWISIMTTATLLSPEFVTITQTKAGCKVGPNGADQLFLTGRAPIAVGAVTSTLGGEVTN